MGHNLYRRLLRTPKWKKVIRLLEDGACIPAIAAATMDASRQGVEQLTKDRGSIYAFWLLTQLPAAAKAEDFPGQLQQIDLPISNQPSLFELVGAYSKAVDIYVRDKANRTDFVEMVQMSATESLTDIIGRDTPTLFKIPASEVQKRLRKYTASEYFGNLASKFFGKLLNRYIVSFLSAELPNHVGPGRRFANWEEYSRFTESIYVYTVKVSESVEPYAADWHSRTSTNGGITEKKVGAFLQKAVKIISEEVGKGGGGAG